MTDADRFLVAIHAAPADDTPRLVFADWLDEHGQPDRAEFIRLQIGLSRGELGPAAEARVHDLLVAHRPEWVHSDIRGSQTFRRGFVEGLYVRADELLEDAEAVGRHPLITDLRLSLPRGHLEAVARIPWLGRIDTFDLRGNTGIFGEFAESLGRRHLPSLRQLVLQNVSLWPNDLDQLAGLLGARMSTVDALNLSGNFLGDDGAARLAGLPPFGRLRELVMRCDMIPFSDAVHANGAETLAESETLTELRLLDLTGHYTGDAGLIDLVGSANARHLHTLGLAKTRIGEIGGRWAEALVESPYLGNLRRLDLSGVENSIGHDAAVELQNWGRLPAALVIDLTNCTMSDRTRELLRTCPRADRFRLDVGPPEDAAR